MKELRPGKKMPETICLCATTVKAALVNGREERGSKGNGITNDPGELLLNTAT